MSIGPIISLPPDRLPQLEALLSASGLPADDCAEQAEIFYALIDDDRLVAAGGLESAGQYALLRSLVVHPDYRARGLARVLCEFLLRRAREQNLAAVYLLTETAAAYFENLGFERLARQRVPVEIQRTRQFSSLCPDSADCLVCDLARYT